MYLILEPATVAESNELDRVYGSFNDPPPNLKEITIDQFLSSPFFMKSPRRMAYRQILYDGRYIDANLFFYDHGEGVALLRDVQDRKFKLRVFTFAKCRHKRRELTPSECAKRGIFHGGRCYHVYECTKCGEIFHVDSSD